MAPGPAVAVVTDSTASLAPTTAARRGLVVLPLHVVIGGRSYADGDPEASPDRLTAALRAHVPVSTSRPSPAAILAAYRQAAADGAAEIVSVHVSGEVSGTCDAARLAARDSPVPVHVVDSRQIGAGTGFAAVAAADAAAGGADGVATAAVARERARATVSLFYVDTLEYLRRGGRVGAAAALVGSALAVKPLLELREGAVSVREKVRTASRALARLESLAVAAAARGTGRPEIAVSHLAAPAPALRLAAALAEVAAGDVRVLEVPAVLGAHVGPGLVGVTVSPPALAPG